MQMIKERDIRLPWRNKKYAPEVATRGKEVYAKNTKDEERVGETMQMAVVSVQNHRENDCYKTKRRADQRT